MIKVWVYTVLAALVSVFAGLYFLGLPDGKKFCAMSKDRDLQDPPIWNYVDATDKHVNSGGKACIEDVIRYAIEFRAGPDGLTRTADDRVSLEQQFDMITKLLKQEFPGGYWTMSKWHFNHNAAVLGQMRMLYADGNEYVLIFGNPLPSSGYSGKYPYDCYDFQIDGEQRNFYISNTTFATYTPDWKRLREKGLNADFAMTLKAGTQKGYAQNGGWMIEYGYGNLVPALYDGVLMPTFFITNDWTSMRVSMSSFAEGFINNNLPFLGRILGIGSQRKWNQNQGKRPQSVHKPLLVPQTN